MYRGIALGVLAVLALTGVAAAGSAPYVDAGLDQEVYLGDRVYLDGGGTWDDDGDITEKEWTIETPDGDTITPDCPDCWFTHFQANQTGQYDATLTVRDSEGHENSDTLYVTTQGLEPEMVASENGADAAGGSGGCWVAHTGGNDGGSIDHDVCSVHGLQVGVAWTEGGEGESVEGYKFEDDGIVDEYSEYEINQEDGTVIVPAHVYHDEAEEIWKANIDSEGGGSMNNAEGRDGGEDGQPGGDTGATSGGNTGGGCIAPCGHGY